MPRPTPGPARGGIPPFDARTVHPLDWVILASGALAFIFSLFDYYRWTIASALDYSGLLDRRPVKGVTIEISAWHGFFGWAAALLALAGALTVALELVGPHLGLVSLRAAGLGTFVAATACVVAARFVGSFVGPRAAALGVETERGVGYWVSLVVIAVGVVASTARWWMTRPNPVRD